MSVQDRLCDLVIDYAREEVRRMAGRKLNLGSHAATEQAIAAFVKDNECSEAHARRVVGKVAKIIRAWPDEQWNALLHFTEAALFPIGSDQA